MRLNFVKNCNEGTCKLSREICSIHTWMFFSISICWSSKRKHVATTTHLTHLCALARFGKHEQFWRMWASVTQSMLSLALQLGKMGYLLLLILYVFVCTMRSGNLTHTQLPQDSWMSMESLRTSWACPHNRIAIGHFILLVFTANNVIIGQLHGSNKSVLLSTCSAGRPAVSLILRNLVNTTTPTTHSRNSFLNGG